jgi:hypothetical protein
MASLTFRSFVTSPVLRGLLVVLAALTPGFLSKGPPQLSFYSFNSTASSSMAFATYVSDPANLHLQAHKIAISSWLLCDPASILILLLNANTSDTTLADYLQGEFGKKRVFVYKNVTNQKEGAPSVHSLLVTALKYTRSGYFCFINPNIVVDPVWYAEAVATIERNRGKSPHLIGQRLEVPIAPEKLAKHKIVAESFFSDLRELFQVNVSCVEQPGNDYFIWVLDAPALPVSTIPDFQIGGGGWDQWMNTCAERERRVVTLRRRVPVYFIGDPKSEEQAITRWNLQLAEKKDFKTLIAHTQLTDIDGERFRNATGRIVLNPPKCKGDAERDQASKLAAH